MLANIFQYLPGIKCKGCAAKGEEVWVIEGTNCSKCGTPAKGDDYDNHDAEFEA